MTGGILEPICKDCAVYFSIIIMIINLRLPLLLDSTVEVEKDVDVEKDTHPKLFARVFFCCFCHSVNVCCEEMLPESLVDFVVLRFQQNLQHC